MNFIADYLNLYSKSLFSSRYKWMLCTIVIKPFGSPFSIIFYSNLNILSNAFLERYAYPFALSIKSSTISTAAHSVTGMVRNIFNAKLVNGILTSGSLVIRLI